VKRKIFDKLFKGFVILLTLLSVAPLLLILFMIVKNGITVINWSFFVKLPAPPGNAGGGVLNSIVGTFELIVLAVAFAIPPGILTGVYLSERRSRFSNVIRTIVNTLQGLPSIVVGIIAYLWVVRPLGGFSALSGGFALSLMMLPVVIKSTEETLKLIPYSLKEASFALGANYGRTLFKVILPSGMGGIISGVVIGISRIAGETAPLLFTAFGNPFLNVNPFKPVDALPLLIFNYAMSPYKSWHEIAWGASLVLVVFVLLLNFVAKMAGEKWKVRF